MSDDATDLNNSEVEDLEVLSIIAFDGTAINAFHTHPDKEHIIFPIGNKVSIFNSNTKKQDFLTVHTNNISAIDLSRDGKYIASGQINYIGFRSLLVIWDFDKREKIAEHEIHKVRVEAITFSANNRFVISIGGRDCGCVVVYDLLNNTPLCGARASPDSAGDTTVLKATTLRSMCFVTGGENTMRIWTIDEDAHAMSKVDVSMAKIKRNIISIALDERDEYAYCGTTTGDVMKVKLNFHAHPDVLKPIKTPNLIGCYGKIDPRPKRSPDTQVICYSKGVRCIYLLHDGRLIIGAGNGDIDLIQECEKKQCELPTKLPMPVVQPTSPKYISLLRKTVNVKAMVTSLQMESDRILVSTTKSEIFSINLNDFSDVKLVLTCHTSAIYSIAFPHNFSEVFATASKDDVRVWSLKKKQELLRICVPNFSCSCVQFTYDGKKILTGWNDGLIRAFTPITGKLIFTILNAHNKGVSALTVTSDGTKIFSGGCEGQIRVWSLQPEKQQLVHVLKEHKGPVTGIDINKYNTEVVSSSSDGSCIVWDIVRLCRKQIFIRNTLFLCVKYYPTGVQILTGGSDRKIAYWELYDGSLIRELEGSLSEAINDLDISADGSMFLTGGNDQIVKLWRYDEGYTTHIGIGHAGVVTKVKFSPNGQYIVSASGSGDIFIWRCPVDVSIKNNMNASDDRKENGCPKDVKVKSTVKKLSNGSGDKVVVEEVKNIDTSSGDKQSVQVEVAQDATVNTTNVPEQRKCSGDEKRSGKSSSTIDATKLRLSQR